MNIKTKNESGGIEEVKVRPLRYLIIKGERFAVHRKLEEENFLFGLYAVTHVETGLRFCDGGNTVKAAMLKAELLAAKITDEKFKHQIQIKSNEYEKS